MLFADAYTHERTCTWTGGSTDAPSALVANLNTYQYEDHSRNRLRAAMAEGVSVLRYPFFDGCSLRKGVFKNSFFEIAPASARERPSVQNPIALESVDVASAKMAGSKTNSIIATVSGYKSVDFASQKEVDTKTGLPPVKAFCFL